MKRNIIQNINLMDTQQDDGDYDRQSLMQAHMDDERRAQQR